MNQSETITESQKSTLSLYSAKAIGWATFLGGPLAAGYMISENYKSLEKPIHGRNALIIGIISTIVLFGGLFMIPEHIIDKIPNQIFPLIYTAIIYGIVEWKQGDTLKSHKENGNPFYSGWRAAGIGFVSLLIIMAGIFGYIYINIDNEVYDKYEKEIVKFTQNEKESLVFYDHLYTRQNHSLIRELEKTTIPKWKENIQIINQTNDIENLPYDLIEQNKILLKYAELRVEAFELLKKSIIAESDIYDKQLDDIHEEIANLVDKLN